MSMDIEAVNRRIRKWSAQTNGEGDPVKNWREMTDEGFLHWYCRCAFSSQTKYETVVAFVKKLENEGLFKPHQRFADKKSYEREVLAVLSTPIPGVGGIRANRRRSEWLAGVAFDMKDHSLSFREILQMHASEPQSVEQPLSSALETRRHLIDKTGKLLPYRVNGFGPKTTSMFLRFVGYYPNFGILDTHIMNYLAETTEIDRGVFNLSSLRGYEVVEAKFREVAKELGFTVKCADEAIWMELSGSDEV